MNLEIIIQCRTVMTHCHVTICLINDWFKVENGYCLNCKQNARKFQAKPNMRTFCESNVLFITSTLSQAQSASTGIPVALARSKLNSNFQNETESIFCWNCKFGKKNEVKTLLDIDIIKQVNKQANWVKNRCVHAVSLIKAVKN